MRLYLHLAWRNLWRNSRRTLISITSIVFAVLLALAMRSMQNGTYDSMIQSAVGLYLGYVQVHAEGFWEKRSLDESVELTNARLLSFDSLSKVTRVVPRLESFVLLSKDSSTKVAQVIGIDPRREDEMTGLARRITAGRFLHKDDRGGIDCRWIGKVLECECWRQRGNLRSRISRSDRCRESSRDRCTQIPVARSR